MSIKDRFKSFMRHVPQPVFIAIVKDIDDEVGGLTVSTFTSISMEPPIGMVSIDKNTRSFFLFKEAQGWTVSLIPSNLSRLATIYADPKYSFEERLSMSKTALSPNLSIPYIKDAIAYVECKPYKHADVGDHVVFFGEVVHVEVIRDKPALVYHKREYKSVS